MNPDSQKFGSLSKPKRYEHVQGPAAPTSLGDFIGHANAPLISFGAVYVNHDRVMDSNHQVVNSDIIRIHLEPKRYPLPTGLLKTRVVFENENFLIMNKPSGLPMHPTLDNYFENLVKGVENFMGTKIYVTHRLDVPTSGLVLLAKSARFQTAFNQTVADRRVGKIYQAFVRKPLALGVKQHWMLATDRAPKTIFSSKLTEPSYECLLEILRCENTFGKSDIHCLDIQLLTGRTHQIRAQLAFEGSPILGDEMYGGEASQFFGLHANSLSFRCPISKMDFNFVSQSKIPDSDLPPEEEALRR